MNNFSVLIVDDEPLAREKIKTFLSEDSEVSRILEAADGLEAAQMIRQHLPDVVFLDVQIPELDGFGVLKSLDVSHIPAIIIVTAHDEYAVRAFEVRVIDYLLKPFDRLRFCEALSRAKERVHSGPVEKLSSRLLELLDSSTVRPRPDRLVAKSDGRTVFIRMGDIDWVEGAGNYIKLHVDSRSHMLRETMNGIEIRLDPSVFLRIHRSTIVNVDRVKELEPWFHGDHKVVLADGTKLTLSKSYRDRFEAALGARL
jgi:two-component system LytT family response regulator